MWGAFSPLRSDRGCKLGKRSEIQTEKDSHVTDSKVVVE